MEAATCASFASRYAFFDCAAIHWGEHLSACEESAPDDIQEAVMRLTSKNSFVLTNWIKYFWVQTGIEYQFPENFDTFIVSAFFNLALKISCSAKSLPPSRPKIGRFSGLRKWAVRIPVLVELSGTVP